MNGSSTIAAPYFFYPDIQSKAIKKLQSFWKMEDGWYYGMGVASASDEVNKAILVAHILEWRGDAYGQNRKRLS